MNTTMMIVLVLLQAFGWLLVAIHARVLLGQHASDHLPRYRAFIGPGFISAMMILSTMLLLQYYPSWLGAWGLIYMMVGLQILMLVSTEIFYFKK
jgi:hypothetical protein